MPASRATTMGPVESRSPISSARSTTTASSIGLGVLARGRRRGEPRRRLRRSFCTSSKSRAPGPPTATAASSTSRCSFRSAPTSAAGSRTPAASGVQLTGASDHFVSEALYLRDPDHHGIEIYADRPRELWEGRVERMGSLPLDLDDLLARCAGRRTAIRSTGCPTGRRWGTSTFASRTSRRRSRFYRDLLGFDLMAQLGPQAAFLSAGGYHHHLGGNTWESRGAAQAPEGTARLRSLHDRAAGRGVASRRQRPRSAAPRRAGPVRQPPALAPQLERGRQRARVHDDERLRRPRQRDVELAQALLVRRDQRRLDDDDVVELEALRLARRQQRDPVPEVAARRIG